MPFFHPNRHFFFYLPMLFLSCFVVIAQNNNNSTVRIGVSLIAGDTKASWLSHSGDFAFGFHQLKDGNFLLAIWYNKISNNSSNVVWYANGDNPAPKNSKIELTAENGLVLTNPEGERLWSSELSPNSSPVKLCVMNDSGNFQILSENSQVRWESFKYPTDTLLPSQAMEIGGVLSSRKNPNEFSDGAYRFVLLSDGNAILNKVDLTTKLVSGTYYESGTNVNTSYSGKRVIFDDSGYLYVELRNGMKFNITEPKDAVPFPDSSYYRKISLGFSGLLSLSHYPIPNTSASNENWIQTKVIPESPCDPHALGTTLCGYNSICTVLQDDQIPNCECPKGYSFIDVSNIYGGCEPNFPLFCDHTNDYENRSGVEFDLQSNINWVFGDYARFYDCEVDECKQSCLEDCFCAAVVYNANLKMCWKKSFPLANGIKESGTTTTSFIKVYNNSSQPTNPIININKSNNNNTTTLVTVLSSLLGSSVFFNFIFITMICYAFFFYYSNKRNYSPPQNESPVKSNFRHFSYNELVDATNGFEKELGRGSCGVVYEGRTEQFGVVAVKKLDRMFQENDKEFQVEVNAVGQTHHKNLVRLIGYCNENQHRLLVYEYMKNGTLSSFLFDGLRPSWNQRIKIAGDLARGLVYLHEDCTTPIIHCDIKPQNVLLDEYYNARISDFGLAKLLGLDQSHTKTNIRGTKGYVAPDWFRSAPISAKVDVYSFGVLLLEIITCRRNVLPLEKDENVILVDWVYHWYEEGRLEALVENDLEAMNEINIVERFVMVALWCVQEDPSIRPAMKMVLLMLEGVLQVSAPPLPSLSSSTFDH